MDDLQALTSDHRAAARRVVLRHGCFDIVHPGHVRYLQAASQHGDVLVVSLTGDDAIGKSDGTRPYIPQQYRAENLAALECVDFVVIADGTTAEPIIAALKPDLYVKGSEYEHSDHPGLARERASVEAGGGRVLFSSGGVTFSSTTLLENLQRAEPSGRPGTGHAAGLDVGHRLAASCHRWGLTPRSMADILMRMRGKRVLVIGDALCDRYSFCETEGCADEAPVLSVSPSHESAYPGGAAVLAAHVQKLGGQATLVSAGGHDTATQEMDQTLRKLGVHTHWLRVRDDLPTKRRYVADSQKLLKINHGVPQPLDSAGEAALLDAADSAAADGLDAVIFADFGYGTLSPRSVTALIERLGPNGHGVHLIAGDVSGPRRTLKAMRDCQLLPPTERELRGIAGDFDGSLPSVAAAVMQELNVPCLMATMGKRGLVLFYPRDPEPAHWFDHPLRSEHLPALSTHAADVVGAGDAMLAAGELFGRDIRDAARIERRFLALDSHRADSARPTEESERDAEHWVMLKRYLWRWGLWDSAHHIDARFTALSEAPALP